jgi:CDP-diacylglycerol--glycerol-3-phosphate 3-phosphatidyltransferase
LNLPNIITLSRIPVMFVIVWLMYCPAPGAATAAFVLFILAAVGDWLDGYIARTQGLVTSFGKLMDALADKIMVLGVVIGFVGIVHEVNGVNENEIPVVLALVTLCREFLVTGMRMVAASKGVIVPADRGGKSKTVTQLIALGFLLAAPMVRLDWPRFFGGDFLSFAMRVHQIGATVFWAGTALAVWSGTRYVLRYRQVVFADSTAA